MKSGKKIKVGVFGAGRGMSMINIMSRHPDAELVAICDKYEPFEKQCGKLAHETGSKIKFYTDFEDFFNHDMDAVVLANYAHEHAPYAVRLLLSGRHIISELMAVETMAQAVQLAEAVEKSGKIYAYAENCCFYPSVLEMKRLYKNGELGEFIHGEGEYIHCAGEHWHLITYGDKNHWRNRILYSTFYCSHSFGPMLTITGARPLKVVGFETPNTGYLAEKGYGGGTHGVMLLQMSNGAVVKNMQGILKREPILHWFCIYGTNGVVESDRHDDNLIHFYKEGSDLTETQISYRPKFRFQTDLSKIIKDHGGSDFYTMHYFLEKILGRPEGEECIDIYQALDMTLPGLLSYRSICNGNIPVEVPDFRDKSIREKYRNDYWCTDAEIAGENKAPSCSFGSPDIPDSVYEKQKKLWEDSQKKA